MSKHSELQNQQPSADELRKDSAPAVDIDDDDDDDDGDDDDDHEEDRREPQAAASALAALRPEHDEEGFAFNHPRAQLDELPVAGKQQAANETETLLNGLIGECGTLLRDVAFRSACLTPDASDRLRFIAAAESLALTASKVADAVGRLRHGGPAVEVRRHEMVFTHTTPSPLPAAKG